MESPTPPRVHPDDVSEQGLCTAGAETGAGTGRRQCREGLEKESGGKTKEEKIANNVRKHDCSKLVFGFGHGILNLVIYKKIS